MKRLAFGVLAVLLLMMLVALTFINWRERHRPGSVRRNGALRWRAAAFIGGITAVWVAVGSPLAGMDHHLLIAHMAQHLLLMTIAAPLLLLGASTAVQRLETIGMRTPGSAMASVGSVVMNPVFCWLASTVIVIGWHVPSLFALGMSSGCWHKMQQTSFLAAGILFWLPVIQPWTSLTRSSQSIAPLYLFLATLPCDALSAFLTFCGYVVYPNYLSTHHHFNLSALADQESAGALMWIWVTFAYLAPAAAITIRILSGQRHPSNVKLAEPR